MRSACARATHRHQGLKYAWPADVLAADGLTPRSITNRVTPLGHTAGMSFGQASGPPAPAKQVQQLLSLLEAAGHTDFRDARGPMGFTQRQAAGKFTRSEVEAFIEQLEAEGVGEGAAPPQPAAATAAPAVTPATARTAAPRAAGRSTELALRKASDAMLAAELQRRGWVVMQP